MQALSKDRTWSFPTRLLGEQVAFAGLLWLGLLAVVTGILVGIAIWSDVTSSGMEVASEAVRWFAAFIGVYLATTQLPLHVTHGKTRRDFAIEAAIFIVLYTAALAVLTAVAFLLERALYAAADWPHRLDEGDDHLYDSPRDLPLIFTEQWLISLIWIAAGALIAIGFYRDDGIGLVTIPGALVPVALGEIARGTNWGPSRLLTEALGDPDVTSVALAVLICVGAFALTLAMIWPIVRDVPIKPRKA